MTKFETSRRISAIGFAGWLFADVLIVLFVVFMGSEVRHSRVEAATPSSSAPSEVNKVGVLEKKTVEFLLNGVDQRGLLVGQELAFSALKALIEDNEDYRTLSNKQRYSPVVLVFSHYSSPDTSLGTVTSQKACELKTSIEDSIFDEETVCRTFFDGKLEYGQVRFEVFLVAK